MGESKHLDGIDLAELKIACQAYIWLIDQKEGDRDTLERCEHAIFEKAMETFYGPDIWDWINERIESVLTLPSLGIVEEKGKPNEPLVKVVLPPRWR